MSPPSLGGQLRIDRGMRVAIIGRLSLITLERAKRTLLRLGAKPHSRSVAGTKLVVIGQGAAVLLRSGEWDDLMRRVREAQVACASELTALRALGLAPPAPLPNRSVPVTSIARPGVFDPPTLQTLQLFDLIDAVDDKVDFQTAVLVREIGRLLEAGVGMPEIVMTLAPSRRRALVGLAPHPTHGGRLVPDNEGGIAVRVGAWLSNLDGQLRLGVHSTGNATADEFVFDRGAGRASGGTSSRVTRTETPGVCVLPIKQDGALGRPAGCRNCRPHDLIPAHRSEHMAHSTEIVSHDAPHACVALSVASW